MFKTLHCIPYSITNKYAVKYVGTVFSYATLPNAYHGSVDIHKIHTVPTINSNGTDTLMSHCLNKLVRKVNSIPDASHHYVTSEPQITCYSTTFHHNVAITAIGKADVYMILAKKADN